MDKDSQIAKLTAARRRFSVRTLPRIWNTGSPESDTGRQSRAIRVPGGHFEFFLARSKLLARQVMNAEGGRRKSVVKVHRPARRANPRAMVV